MGALISGPKIPPPPAPIIPTTPVNPDTENSGAAVANARQKVRAAAALAQGRGSTILTSAQGLNSGANTAKKSLLGG